MTDEAIVELCWERSETAISETEQLYDTEGFTGICRNNADPLSDRMTCNFI